MRNEQKIREIMQTGMQEEGTRTRALRAVSRARRQVGQQDTISFALFRIWAVLARLLAPFFAFLGERQAQVMYRQGAARAVPPGADSDEEGKSDD